MTEPRQDLPTDPPLSRLYRDHAVDEPTDAVDQTILAAARQAVAADPHGIRRNGWWQRWRMPLSLAVTVMLTVTLALLVEHQPKEMSVIPSHEKERSENARDRAAPPPIPAAPATKALPVPAAPQIQETVPKAEVGQSERESSRTANTADQAAALPSPAAKAESAAPAAAASEGASSGEMRVSPARPAAVPLAKSSADSVRAPAVWLDEIRVLRNSGKAEEAEEQLRKFRLAHPDYPLPEEFRR